MENIRLIGAAIVLTVAAGLIYAIWSVSTEKAVYGRLGKPSRAVALYAAATALAATVGVVIIFNL